MIKTVIFAIQICSFGTYSHKIKKRRYDLKTFYSVNSKQFRRIFYKFISEEKNQ